MEPIIRFTIGGLTGSFTLNEPDTAGQAGKTWNIDADIVIEAAGNPAKIVTEGYCDSYSNTSVESGYMHRQSMVISGALNTTVANIFLLQAMPVDYTTAGTIICKSLTVFKY